MAACVPILRQEIAALRAAGANTVQLDEPWLSTLVDPAFRKKEGVADVRYEMDLCVDLINQTLDGIEGIETGIDLEGLLEASRWLETRLGRELEGQVYRAGTFAPVAS